MDPWRKNKESYIEINKTLVNKKTGYESDEEESLEESSEDSIKDPTNKFHKLAKLFLTEFSNEERMELIKSMAGIVLNIQATRENMTKEECIEKYCNDLPEHYDNACNFFKKEIEEYARVTTISEDKLYEESPDHECMFRMTP